MRHLSAVIDQLLRVVPEDKADLIKELTSIGESTMYMAPELLGNAWNACGMVLNNNIPFTPDLNEWEKKVVDIWMDQ